MEVSDQPHVHAALPPRYASNSRFGGPQSWFGHFAEKNRMSNRPTIKLVIFSTALSWLREENSEKLTVRRLDCGVNNYITPQKGKRLFRKGQINFCRRHE